MVNGIFPRALMIKEKHPSLLIKRITESRIFAKSKGKTSNFEMSLDLIKM